MHCIVSVLSDWLTHHPEVERSEGVGHTFEVIFNFTANASLRIVWQTLFSFYHSGKKCCIGKGTNV